MAKSAMSKRNATKAISLRGSWPSGDTFGDPSSELPFGPLPKEDTTEFARLIRELDEDDPVRSLWRCIKPRSRKPGVWHHLHEDAAPDSPDPDARMACDIWWISDGTLEDMVQQLRMLLWDVVGIDMRLRARHER